MDGMGDDPKQPYGGLVEKSAPQNLDDVKSHIAFLCAYPKKFAQAKKYLERREWKVFSTSSLNTMIQYITKNKPEFLMVSVDHPSPKVMALPKLFMQMFNTHSIIFSETLERKSLTKLNGIMCRYKYDGNISGPAIHRKIFQLLTELYTTFEVEKKGEKVVTKKLGGLGPKKSEVKMQNHQHKYQSGGVGGVQNTTGQSATISRSVGVKSLDCFGLGDSENNSNLSEEEIIKKFQEALKSSVVDESPSQEGSLSESFETEKSVTSESSSVHQQNPKTESHFAHQNGMGSDTLVSDPATEGSMNLGTEVEKAPTLKKNLVQDGEEIGETSDSILPEVADFKSPENIEQNFEPVPDRIKDKDILGTFDAISNATELDESLMVSRGSMVEYMVAVPVWTKSVVGYLIVPLKHGSGEAEKFGVDFKAIIDQHIVSSMRIFEPVIVHVKPFLFRDWVEKEALFSSYTDAEDKPVDYCFIEYKEILPKQDECHVKGKFSIEPDLIVVDKPVDFNLYFYMKKNAKYLLYLKVDHILTQKRLDNLVRRGVTLSIDDADSYKFNRYYIENVLAEKILSLRRDSKIAS